MQNDVRAIISSMQPEDRNYILSLPEDELIRLHHTLGRYLRNEFRAGLYPDLFKFCSDQQALETRSFDSISAVAIRLVWQHLQQLAPDNANL